MRQSLLFVSLFSSALGVACSSPSTGGPDDEIHNPNRAEAPAGQQPTEPAPSPAAPLPGPAPGEALPACVASPACAGAVAPPFTKRAFKSTLSSVVASGDPHHRGRDAIFTSGAAQTLIGKFTYGANDKDLKGEEVDVFVQRGCEGAWEKLGTATTTLEDAHAAVDNVPDSGGRVYFEVPTDRLLPEGRHRVAMVVAGDGTLTDLLVDVVPKGTRFFASDVDGTLTTSETAEVGAAVGGSVPEANADAAAVLTKLAAKGYRPFYLTARPEWDTGRTREFLAMRGFPRGAVHTTTALTPATGDAAATFKTAELRSVRDRNASIALAFGNTASDADAYQEASIPKEGRVFFQFSDATYGGRRIAAYKELLADIDKLSPACK